jgi:tRNA/rRNA methyltransferase
MVGAGTDRTRPRLGGGPAIILVRPQLAVNIGMCARAMANFGLEDLRLVNPRQGWPRTDEYRDVAYSAAAGATGLLDAAKLFPSVEAAIGDLRTVYATTARERGQMKAVLAPSVAMGESAAALAEKRGILFGPERTGLDNDEVALADAIVTFPTSPTYASLNLSQAVLLCGYEWFKAAHGDAPPPPTIPRPKSPPAQREMLIAFFNYLEDRLDQNGFFRPVTKKPGMRRNLRNILHRMALTQQDVRTLWGAVVRLAEGPRVEVQTRKRERPKKTEA